MTTAAIEPRIRRPKDKERLIQQLHGDNDGPFTTMRDILLFAAAFGWSRQRSDKFSDAEEPIRYDVFRRSATAEAFIDSLAILAKPENPMILAEDRLSERIAIFEEYANGGLAELQKEINASRATVTEVLTSLVRRAGVSEETSRGLPPELEKFLGPADWS